MFFLEGDWTCLYYYYFFIIFAKKEESKKRGSDQDPRPSNACDDRPLCYVNSSAQWKTTRYVLRDLSCNGDFRYWTLGARSWFDAVPIRRNNMLLYSHKSMRTPYHHYYHHHQLHHLYTTNTPILPLLLHLLLPLLLYIVFRYITMCCQRAAYTESRTTCPAHFTLRSWNIGKELLLGRFWKIKEIEMNRK